MVREGKERERDGKRGEREREREKKAKRMREVEAVGAQRQGEVRTWQFSPWLIFCSICTHSGEDCTP